MIPQVRERHWSMTCRAFHCRKQLGHSTWLSRSRRHHGRGHGWRGDYVKSPEGWLPGGGGGGGYQWYGQREGDYLNVARLECVGLLGYRMWAYHRNEGKGRPCDDRREQKLLLPNKILHTCTSTFSVFSSDSHLLQIVAVAKFQVLGLRTLP